MTEAKLLTIQCQSCDRRLKVPAAVAGRTIICPYCQTQFSAPIRPPQRPQKAVPGPRMQPAQPDPMAADVNPAQLYRRRQQRRKTITLAVAISTTVICLVGGTILVVYVTSRMSSISQHSAQGQNPSGQNKVRLLAWYESKALTVFGAGQFVLPDSKTYVILKVRLAVQPNQEAAGDLRLHQFKVLSSDGSEYYARGFSMADGQGFNFGEITGLIPVTNSLTFKVVVVVPQEKLETGGLRFQYKEYAPIKLAE